MSKKEGDTCEICNEGKISLHLDKIDSDDEKGNYVSHKSWLCDKCGHMSKHNKVGILD